MASAVRDQPPPVIPFLDLATAHTAFADEVAAAMERVLARGRFILGEEVEAFEQDFAGYCGAQHCVGVGSGLDAITLLLEAAGIGPGDEVIVPSNTYIATWLGVTRAGATPVPVEPRLDTYNLDPGLVASAITRRTRAVLAVHLYGQPADMAGLAEVCGAHGVALFVDAAQAHGAAVGNRRAAALGDGAAFSFYPTKNLGALGDAGAVVLDDAALADRVRLLRNYGSPRKHVNEVQGANSRLDELQAAVLRVKLRRLDGWNRRRQDLASQYGDQLGGLPGLVLPHVPGWASPVWHVYVVRHRRRDQLADHLAAAGIGTQPFYPVPPHLSPAFASPRHGQGAFPLAEEIAGTNLALPLRPDLEDEDVKRIVEAVSQFAAGG